MTIAVLFIIIAAGIAHAIITKQSDRIAEFVLLYVLVGYCALPLGFIGIRAIAAPEITIRNLHLAAEPSVIRVLGSVVTALAMIALLALRFRGIFLLAPVIGWSMFWASANFMHLALTAAHGATPSDGYMLRIFVAHGFVSILLPAMFAVYWRKGMPGFEQPLIAS